MHRALSRRQILHRAAATAALAKLGLGCQPKVADSALVELDEIPPITPNDEFYTVQYSYSSRPDESWVDTWTLTIGGSPEGDVTLTLADLEALESATAEHTLECISNTREYNAIGNAEWTGVKLKDLLATLGLSQPDGFEYLVFECGDGYHTAVPVADLDRGLRLVWKMNGEDLPIAHGLPLRALTPGRYGMKNPKWITTIRWAETWEEGTWEDLGWSREANVQLQSWFHDPPEGSVFPAEGGQIVGSAFAGRTPIARVQLSDDDGDTWTNAEITYAGPANVWTLWRFQWTPRGSGKSTLLVRAVDEDGTVQAGDERYDADLDGLEGLDAREFEVA